MTEFLPPGQHWLDGPMPRFGLPDYIARWIEPTQVTALSVFADGATPLIIPHAELRQLPRTTHSADFHCVTTWSKPALTWTGWAFRDVWQSFIQPLAPCDTTHLMATGADQFESCIPLSELLKSDTLLADTLNGEPLNVLHGAPLRLVIPQLYGYKNIKHLKRLELLRADRPSRDGRFLVHSRGRVDLEERSGAGFQPFWRTLYHWQLPQFLAMVGKFQTPPQHGKV